MPSMKLLFSGKNAMYLLNVIVSNTYQVTNLLAMCSSLTLDSRGISMTNVYV